MELFTFIDYVVVVSVEALAEIQFNFGIHIYALICFQKILSDEMITLKFLDVITILLKHCGAKLKEQGETRAVIVDILAFLGFLCANQKAYQVSYLFLRVGEKCVLIHRSHRSC